MSQTLHQVKFAEHYFADRQIPVLLPLKDCYDRTAFLMGKNWYSLFPFVDLNTKQVHEVTDQQVQLLGRQLGEIHKKGSGIGREMHPLLLLDKHRFSLEAAELERALAKIPQFNRIEKMIHAMIEKKRSFASSNAFSVHGEGLAFDTLLHGDFGYQNVFFSEDESRIEAIYDFEKAARGPRAFELARSMFITCFDDGWEQSHIDRGSLFVLGYQSVYPIDFKSFQLGVRMYLTHLAHQTWVERKVLLKNSMDHLDLLEIHARRIDHLGDDLTTLAEEIFYNA